MPTISFISANYVARATNYDGDEDWDHHDSATIELIKASPTGEHFSAVARDAALAGFDTIDVWTAHCHYRHHAGPRFDDYLEIVKGICSQYDLAIATYAGGLSPGPGGDLEAPFRFMKQLGAPVFAGGLWGAQMSEVVRSVNDICEKFDVRWAFENHPEKTPEQVFEKIGRGQFPRIGVALDTGWFGTQGFDALEAIKRLREHLLAVHLKDVKAPGRHDTCTLGDGIVPVEQVARYLAQTDFKGPICIEHEPYDRDPMPEIMTSLERLKQWLK
jgi:sugar phosphate isomerase/epimerase